MSKSKKSDLVRWARRATAGLDSSSFMIGVVDWDKTDRNSNSYWTFALQVGRCLLEGKPLLLIVPTGTEVPERLKAAASVIEYYRDGDQASVQAAVSRALEAVGVVVTH